MQRRSHVDEEYSKTIYTVTLPIKLYNALKRLTLNSSNQYIGDTIVQLLKEHPEVKKELERL